MGRPKGKKRLTILSLAVAIRVITSEDNAGAIARGDLLEPSDGDSGWALTKVLLVDFGFVAVHEDYWFVWLARGSLVGEMGEWEWEDGCTVVLGMFGHLDGLS